jgi:hypothetical protein
MKGTIQFRTKRNGIKIATKDMVNYSALMRNLESSKIPYTFHQKSLKPVKAVTR